MHIKLRFLFCLLLVLTASRVHAQYSGDPYQRLSEPFEITDLHDFYGIFNGPLHGVGQMDGSAHIDAVDGSFILAGDTGTGILTHFWFTTVDPDSITTMKLWVDDSLAVSGAVSDFFRGTVGNFRPPFIYRGSGGWVCDLQVPYNKNFRVTYSNNRNGASGGQFWYGLEWRPMDTIYGPISTLQSAAEQSYESTAESMYNNVENQLPTSGYDSVELSTTIPPGDTIQACNIIGQAQIQQLLLQCPDATGTMLDSLYLTISWDGDPYPSVAAPIGDLFCADFGVKNNHSLYLRSDSVTGVMRMTFPMPFQASAMMKIANLSHSPLQVNATVQYSRNVPTFVHTGYFHADFHESNPTKYGLFHPVLHTRGRGRYVGMVLQIPRLSNPVALEGNPFFMADSSPAHSYDFTGTEDYFDGGFYFKDGVFSDPFAGCLDLHDAMYRFHCLDGMDFDSSFDFDLQHGQKNDVHEDYRTVAFYYKEWTPFWVSRDTIEAGETWSIAGWDYTPNSTVDIGMGSISIATVPTDSNGKFIWQDTVPQSWTPGKYYLGVQQQYESDAMPEPIYVIEHPTLRLLVDSLPAVLQYGDTLAFTGTGYNPGETLKFTLGQNEVEPLDPVLIGSDYRFTNRVVIPLIRAGTYSLAVTGSESGVGTCSTPIYITNARNYEFENLLPPKSASNNSWHPEVVSYWWQARWSEQAVADFLPQKIGDSITFEFNVPQADVFRVCIFATKGLFFGNYSYSVDGEHEGSFLGYFVPQTGSEWPTDTLPGGTMHLDSGLHTVTFYYTGSTPAATSNQLSADHLVLIPADYVSVPPGQSSHIPELRIFPNPADGSFNVSLSNPGNRVDGRIEVHDILGRLVATLLVPGSSSSVRLDGSKLANGAYQVRYLSEDGNISRGTQLILFH